MQTFASRVWRFFTTLDPPRMPRGVRLMNPYDDAVVRGCFRAFLDAHFADAGRRTLVIGINPGRFGAGVTGVMFTDPVALADHCGVPNPFPRRRELSSEFVYAAIAAFGGVTAFYQSFFLTAASPLGFTRDGRNLNYYDDADLERRVEPFIVRTLRRQIAIGGRPEVAVVLGKGANLDRLERLNARHSLFGDLISLEHPRWVMQYRRRSMDRYLADYVSACNEALKRTGSG